MSLELISCVIVFRCDAAHRILRSPTFGTMRPGWLIALFVPVLCCAQPGPWWAYGFGGPADDRFTAVAQGPGDTLYACGTFSGLMDSRSNPTTS